MCNPGEADSFKKYWNDNDLLNLELDATNPTPYSHDDL